MVFETHRPELEALIRQHMVSGTFRDVDDLLAKALGTLGEPVAAELFEPKAQSFVKLVEPVGGRLSDKEAAALFHRISSVQQTARSGTSGFLHDTNIPSETLRPGPDARVVGWLPT